MATERAEFELVLDDKPFQQSMNRARGATVGLTDSVNKAGASIGAAATSVSGLNTALGGSVGKTNDLIGAAGNLASTFAAAGPVGLAIAAATTGIGLLVDAWQDAQEEAKKTAEETAKQAVRIEKQLAEVTLRIRARAAGVSTDLAKAVNEQNELAKKAAEQERFLALYGFGGNRATLPAASSGPLVAGGVTIQADSPLAAKIRKASAEFTEFNKQAKEAEAYVAGMIELEGLDPNRPDGVPLSPTGGRRGRRGRGGGAAAGDDFVGPQMPFYVAQARRQQDDGTGLLLEMAFQEFDTRSELARRLADVEIAETDRASREIEQRTQERINVTTDFVMQGLTTTLSLSEQVGMMMVRGQENAADAILNVFAQQIGSMIVGYGLQVAADGVPKLFNPATAAIGFLQIGAGTALAGSGVAIRVGGAAALESGAVSNLIGGIGLPTDLPGVGGGGAGGAAAASSPGAGGAAGGFGGGGGGGLTINVYNGIGMSREDTQRAVVEALREGLRRGYR